MVRFIILIMLGVMLEVGQCQRAVVEWAKGGHGGPVWIAGQSGYSLVSASHDGTVKLWNFRRGYVRTLPMGFGNIAYKVWFESVALSPDGQRMAAGGSVYLNYRKTHWAVNFIVPRSRKGVIFLWTANQCLPQMITVPEDTILCLTFSPDGQMLVAGTKTGKILVFDSQGSLAHQWVAHEKAVNSLSFSSQAPYLLASAGSDGRVKVWRSGSWELVTVLTGHTAPVTGVTFTPSGDLLVSGSRDRTVRLWKVQDWSLQNTLQYSGEVTCVAVSPNGAYLAVGLSNRQIQLGRLQPIDINPRTLIGHTHRITSLVFDPRSEFLFSASYDCTIRGWYVQTTGSWLVSDIVGEVCDAVISLDGRWIVQVGWGDKLYIRDTQMGNLVTTITIPHPDPNIGYLRHFLHATFSNDGRYLFVGASNGCAVLRTTDWSLMTVLSRERVVRIAISSDDKVLGLATGDVANTLRLYRYNNGNWEERAVCNLSNHHTGRLNQIVSLRFWPATANPQMRYYLAVGIADGIVDILDVPPSFLDSGPHTDCNWYSGRKVRSITTMGHLGDVVISADGNLLTMAGIQYEFDSLPNDYKLTNFRGWVQQYRFEPAGFVRNAVMPWKGCRALDQNPLDGRTVVAHFRFAGTSSLSIEGVLYRPITWEDGNTIFSVRFAPDGRHIVYGTADGTLRYLKLCCAGDVDCNGIVDDADLLMILFHFGQQDCTMRYDLTGDGVVDDADVLEVLFHFGEDCH